MIGKVYVTLRILLCAICLLLILNVFLNYFGEKTDIPSAFSRSNLRKQPYKSNVTGFNNINEILPIPSFTGANAANASESLEQENKNITEVTLPACQEPVYEESSPFVPNITLESLDVVEEQLGPLLESGGAFKPKDCNAKHHVAIVVPFRDRYAHLSIFLRNMHPFLMKQNITYRIFIIEQTNGQSFNRAALMNVGFLEAMKLYPWDCFIFHDVDLLPLDNRNLYTCPRQPRHMSVAVDEFNYRLPYRTIFGGVSAMTREHFVLVNGFSNSFFGWGAEDDDMSNRLRSANLFIARYPINIARYIMLKHPKEKANPKRYENLVNGMHKIGTDGLNSIKYEIYSYKSYPTFSWYYAELKITEQKS
uniref:Beta-1,4-N-acetylgalactosaminyltransferase n=1 Tax=Glossina pallidipes TaxID=7398 RepID=A0A1A9ZPC3_GLOPL